MKTNKIILFAICDYDSLPNGGEVMLLNNFLSAVESDRNKYYLVGMSFDKKDIPGVWTKKYIDGKAYDFLPVTRVLKDKEKTHIPFRLRVVEGMFRYRKAISEVEADYWYIHAAELAMALPSKGKTKLFYHVHGDPCQTLRVSRFPVFRASIFTDCYWKIIESAMRKSDRIIWAAKRSNSLYLEQQPHMENVIKNKSIVIHSSFDTKLKVGNKDSLKLEPNRKHLVTVGRLSHVKRIDFIIEAVAKVISEGYEVDLLICGDGEEMDTLRKLSQSLNVGDRVNFLGLCDRVQIATALDVSECFLFASENEAMSLVVLESLYMGTPVISTDVGDIPDIVVNDNTGYIVDGYSLEKYCEKIKHIVDMGKCVYSERCKAVAAHYTPNKMAKAIDEAFYD